MIKSIVNSCDRCRCLCDCFSIVSDYLSSQFFVEFCQFRKQFDWRDREFSEIDRNRFMREERWTVRSRRRERLRDQDCCNDICSFDNRDRLNDYRWLLSRWLLIEDRLNEWWYLLNNWRLIKDRLNRELCSNIMNVLFNNSWKSTICLLRRDDERDIAHSSINVCIDRNAFQIINECRFMKHEYLSSLSQSMWYMREEHIFIKSFSINNIWSIRSIFRSTECIFKSLSFYWSSASNWLFNSIALNSNNLKSTFNECAFNKSSTSKRTSKKDFKSR